MCCSPPAHPNKPFPTRYRIGYYFVFLVCVVVIGGIADALSNKSEHPELNDDPVV